MQRLFRTSEKIGLTGKFVIFVHVLDSRTIFNFCPGPELRDIFLAKVGLPGLFDFLNCPSRPIFVLLDLNNNSLVQDRCSYKVFRKQNRKAFKSRDARFYI